MCDSSRSFLQQTLVTLNQCVRRAGLTINESKTEALKFRVGGRSASRDEFRLEGQQIKLVMTRRTFSGRIEQWVVKTLLRAPIEHDIWCLKGRRLSQL